MWHAGECPKAPARGAMGQCRCCRGGFDTMSVRHRARTRQNDRPLRQHAPREARVSSCERRQNRTARSSRNVLRLRPLLSCEPLCSVGQLSSVGNLDLGRRHVETRLRRLDVSADVTQAVVRYPPSLGWFMALNCTCSSTNKKRYCPSR